jgi:5'-3' exoribonuclease 1
MGVPKFFRWLSERYPLINQRVLEKNQFDCFYLDMNGIIHNVFQKKKENNKLTEEKIFEQIFFFTNHLFRIVRPRKLIYLAIDGVAPRAKMNQQRSRRFRSAKELEKEIFNKKNETFDNFQSLNSCDSNCITPGTNFMDKLSTRFKIWIQTQITNDKEWQQGCDIIFSGAEVPGEGEHKIMNFIRKMQKYQKYRLKSLKHCLYGLDADLIMLGLVSHEKSFTLLREKLAWRGNQKILGSHGNFKSLYDPTSEEFHLLEISLLRDMLFFEFKPREYFFFKYVSERIIDDFIFMCMLIGNDFLPGLPHLDIAFGGLNLLVRSYKEIQKDIRGYLTNKHQIHPGRVEIFLEKLSNGPEEIFFFQKKDINSEKAPLREYRKNYYSSKFSIDPIDKNFSKVLEEQKKNYFLGLHWCLYYYHKGCPSWNWFYPFYYTPLGSDLKWLSEINIKFRKGRPFEPLVQLLAVLPPKSSNLLPLSFGNLMTNRKSRLIEFYPQEFELDMNGKRNLWEGIILLPFINQNMLIKEIYENASLEKLTSEEEERNSFGKDTVFFLKK